MWENKEQRRRKFSVIFLCAMLWSMGVGPDLGKAQTKESELLNSPNRILASTAEVLDVSENADKKYSMIPKNQQGDVCRKSQVATQLVRLENHSQTGNHTHQESYANNIRIIDLELQSDINTKWSKMIRALKDGDKEGTLRFIFMNQREAARKDWTVLNKYLDNLAENFSEPLHVTAINENQMVAQAMMPPTQTSLLCPLEVKFGLDTDGQWRLRYD